ncbi:unnamed protein product [Linum trigynum]|uniref:Uncharacterized protein n=1 Tax=Linum trigynum TaxID=586398 RepID=A0AAV2D0G5_9ROSI
MAAIMENQILGTSTGLSNRSQSEANRRSHRILVFRLHQPPTTMVVSSNVSPSLSPSSSKFSPVKICNLNYLFAPSYAWKIDLLVNPFRKWKSAIDIVEASSKDASL